jgi:hypothetical protein
VITLNSIIVFGCGVDVDDERGGFDSGDRKERGRGGGGG